MGQGNRYLGRTGALTLLPLGGPAPSETRQRAIDARMSSSTVQHPCNHLFRLTKTLLLSRETNTRPANASFIARIKSSIHKHLLYVA